MSAWTRLMHLAISAADQVALQDGQHCLNYRQLIRDVSTAAEWLREHNIQRMALQLDNSVSFVLWDLAAQVADVVCVPLPLFFTAAQQQHVLNQASIDLLLMPKQLPGPNTGNGFTAVAPPAITSLGNDIAGYTRKLEQVTALPLGTSKITFTSGTTGTPKGVCLSAQQQWQVAQSLQAVTSTLAIATHLCVLPLAVLLENVAGVYSALLSGARVVLPPLKDVGLTGSSQFDPSVLLHRIEREQANSIILLPQMLSSLLTVLEQAPTIFRHDSLHFVAVGGARVSAELLARAEALAIPVYEGYGLSECASVVAVNTPTDRRAGTVGKPLPHVRVERTNDGELLIHGNAFLGYLDSDGSTGVEQNPQGNVVATGDIGTIDRDGFLQINGRKKNLLITSFGRNVSPEWPESELLAEPEFLQAAVFGESQPALAAVVVTLPDCSVASVQAALARVNRRLPDYAQLRFALPATEAFRVENGLLTSNGRPKREAIWQRYGSAVLSRYLIDANQTPADSPLTLPSPVC